MTKTLTLVICLLLVLSMAGCNTINGVENDFQGCSNDWYNFIEKKISTGDNQGHGPDIGSTEWRSVIEFKLGIRGDSKVPPLGSEQWCDYINQYYSDTHAYQVIQ